MTLKTANRIPSSRANRQQDGFCQQWARCGRVAPGRPQRFLLPDTAREQQKIGHICAAITNTHPTGEQNNSVHGRWPHLSTA